MSSEKLYQVSYLGIKTLQPIFNLDKYKNVGLENKHFAKRETPSVGVVMVGWGWFGGGVGVVWWWFGDDVRVVRGGVGVVWGWFGGGEGDGLV